MSFQAIETTGTNRYELSLQQPVEATDRLQPARRCPAGALVIDVLDER
ncbi:MAG: hypothetical protein OXD42_13225 [Rhodospirillaceae bacterium]|nr:hypothetical protein [Rhodospirillaceae bacterium]MCY4239822.1 hypothetical protein [Rhodospirillaceae bacterium]